MIKTLAIMKQLSKTKLPKILELTTLVGCVIFRERLHFMETPTHLLFQLWWFLLWANKEDGFPCLLGHIFAMKPTTMDTLSHEANWEHF
jgi:hypothetical protein